MTQKDAVPSGGLSRYEALQRPAITGNPAVIPLGDPRYDFAVAAAVRDLHPSDREWLRRAQRTLAVAATNGPLRQLAADLERYLNATANPPRRRSRRRSDAGVAQPGGGWISGPCLSPADIGPGPS